MLIRYLIFLTFVYCSGCQSYQPKPLISQDSLQVVEASRNNLLENNSENRTVASDQKFTFIKAVQILAQNSPSLKEAYSEYKKANEYAKFKTPFPNPELEVGTLIGTQLGNDDSGRVQPLVAFGFTIPLGSRLTKQDNVNSAMADYAYLKYLLQHRIEYLQLRKLYVQWILLEERKKVYDDIIQSIETSFQITKQLIEVGTGTALDVGIIELDLQQRQAQKLKIEGEIIHLKGKLSQTLGVNSNFFVFSQPHIFPKLPEKFPLLTELKDMMLLNNSTLALLQATYQIVENELSLEISKQTPDITLAPSFEGDPGDDKKIWGLSVRFPLPIFDQNQREIKNKEEKRELVKTQYEGALNNDLAVLEKSYKYYEHQQSLFFEVHNKMLVKAKENVAIAFETLKRGEIDFLKYIDTERTLRDVLLEVHQSKTNMYESWLNMELIIGKPFWLLPEERAENIPAILHDTSKENRSTLPQVNKGGGKK